MGPFERFCPDPVPAIHQLPEYQATGERARWYGDIKAALQVPWIGVVTMAYAHYPAFFAELRRGLEPLCRSEPFVAHAMALRALVDDGAAGLDPPPIAARLQDMGYGAGTCFGRPFSRSSKSAWKESIRREAMNSTPAVTGRSVTRALIRLELPNRPARMRHGVEDRRNRT